MVKPGQQQASDRLSSSSFNTNKNKKKMKETKSPEKPISVSSSAKKDDVAQPEELDPGYNTDYKKLSDDLR